MNAWDLLRYGDERYCFPNFVLVNTYAAQQLLEILLCKNMKVISPGFVVVLVYAKRGSTAKAFQIEAATILLHNLKEWKQCNKVRTKIT